MKAQPNPHGAIRCSAMFSAASTTNAVRALLLVGFATVLAPAVAAQAPAFLAPASSAQNSSTSVSSLTWSHTVTASGSNRVLIVGVAIARKGGSQTVSSITYSGQNLSPIGSQSNGTDVRMEMWQLTDPPTGANNVVVTLSAGARFTAGAMTFSGVGSLGSFVSASGTGSPATVDVSSATNELVVDTLATDDSSGASVGAGQTEHWSNNTTGGSNGARGGGSSELGASTVTMSWTLGGRQPWAVGALPLKPLGPSLARLTSFKAIDKGNGKIKLAWRTGYEVDNLGFNVYREQNGQYTRITRKPVAGSALLAGQAVELTAGNSYSWKDRISGGVGEVRYWLEDIDLNGDSTWHGPVIVTRKDNDIVAIPQESVLLSEVGQDWQANAAELTQPVGRKAKLPAITMTAALSLETNIASLPALKLAVNREGWYRVSQAELMGAGLNPKTDPRNLQLYVDGQEQPIIVTGEKDGSLDTEDSVEFYGIGLDAPSTDTRVYWLIEGQRPGRRISFANQPGSQPAAESFLYTVERKDKSVFFAALKNGEADNFFGAVVSATPSDQTLTLQSVDSAFGKEASLQVTLQGVTQLPHKVSIAVNGAQVGEVVFTGQQQGVAKLSIPQSLLADGANRVTLAALGGTSDFSLVESIRLSYWHTYKADNDVLRFTALGRDEVTIEGFTTPNVRVIDITSASAPQEVASEVKKNDGGFTVSLGVPGIGKRTLLAVTTESARKVATVVANQPSNWRNKARGADLVIISHRDFLGSVEPLRALRESQGLSVAVADIEDIYDEFSWGHKTTGAVKDFLAFARSNWQRSPRFVLLVGDASYDPRNYLGRGISDFVPAKFVDTSLMETTSDDWFTDFNQDALAEMAVGRLPVRTRQEADALVAKIVGYEKSVAPAGKSGALLVADSNDGFNFESATTQLRGLLPRGLAVKQVVRGRTDDTTAKAEVIDSINQGQKIVNYLGHGGTRNWRGNLITSSDATALTNTHLPMLVLMTCLNGYFQDVNGDSLAESLLKAGGGAMAVWASSSMTSPAGQAAMNHELYRQLFSGKQVTIGEAIMRAKAATSDRDARASWILFGDPTSRLK